MINKELEIKKELEGVELQDNELEDVAGGDTLTYNGTNKNQQKLNSVNAQEKLDSYAPIIS